MTGETRTKVRRMLETHNTATLATTREGWPWAATVFYASDVDLNLYFVSDPRTRHGGDLAARPEVAAAINADCPAWSEIRGLQLTGRVEVLAGAERAEGFARYLAKFHDVMALFERPQGVEEESIAERLKAANLYRLTPRWIRLIDNARQFGYKEEIDLRPMGQPTP